MLNTHRLPKKPIQSLICLLSLLCVSTVMAGADQAKTADEKQFNQVTLTETAIKKLGIKVQAICAMNTASARSFPAQVSYAPQAHTAYTTPFNGYVYLNPGLKLGAKMKAGQSLLKIRPVVTPDTRLSLLTSLADTEGQLQTSQEQVEAARLAFHRARQLLTQHVGSQRSLDEAQASLAIAESTLNSIKQKHRLLKQAVADGGTTMIDIKATQTGVISHVSITSGQLVVAGSPLMELIATHAFVITALVPPEQVKTLQLKDAWISDRNLSDEDITLKQIALPAEADLQTGMRKVMYTAPKSDALAAMQKLRIHILEQGPNRLALKLPCASVVVDMYGGEWIYLKEDATHFRRERILVSGHTQQACAFSNPRLNGMTVVTQGAQELFALETGYTH